MKTTIQLKTKFGNVLFECSKENNTVKDTLEEANKQKVDLSNIYLADVDLSGIKLKEIDLRSATFFRVNLNEAYLEDVEFIYSDFYSTTFIGTKFTRVNLCYINFYNTILRDATLIHSNLDSSDFYNTTFEQSYLEFTSLKFSKLYDCGLQSAQFYNVVFTGTKFHDTDLTCVSLISPINLNVPMNLPEGEFIAWKKLNRNIIVKLKIPEDSKRSRAFGDKCRCDKALVLEFQHIKGNKLDFISIVNKNDFSDCVYKVGEIVYPDKWDKNRFNECSHGIHFFLDRQSAINYQLHTNFIQ